MKSRKNHTQLFGLLIMTIILASGCGLAPKEEAIPDAPVISHGDVQEYKKVSVIRGDIVDSVNVDCSYKASKTENMKFKISGLSIDHVYVEEGDTVQKGEILAELEMEDINSQVSVCSDNIELLKLKIAQQTELKQLAVSNQDKLRNVSGFNDQIASEYHQEILNYDNTQEKLQDNLFIEKERLEQLQEDIKNHQIIAGIDGVVSYVGTHQYGEASDKDTIFITIYDPATMLFVTDGKYSELFTPAQKVDINASQKLYKAEVILLQEQDKVSTENEENNVYLKVDNTEELLQKDDQGKITIIKNQLKDVLYLPASAVHEDNGKYIVYVEDEGGFKSIKEVKTGLSADRKVEIISGVKEGDNVILE